VVTTGTTINDTKAGRKKYTATVSARERKKSIQNIFFWLLVISL
jgi:hypothetical protein